MRWQDRDAAASADRGRAVDRAARGAAGRARRDADRHGAPRSGAAARSSTRPRSASWRPAALGAVGRSTRARRGSRPATRCGVTAGGESAVATATVRTGVPAGSVFLGGARLPEGAVELAAARQGAAPDARGHARPDREVDRDLRGLPADRPARAARRAQAAGPLPVAHRPQPGRPEGPDAAARRRAEAALQGAVHPGHRGAVDDGDRAGDLGHDRGRDDGDHPVRPLRRLGRRLRPLRDRRLDRAALLLRLRLARASTG